MILSSNTVQMPENGLVNMQKYKGEDENEKEINECS